jgi:hypothetical protein
MMLHPVVRSTGPRLGGHGMSSPISVPGGVAITAITRVWIRGADPIGLGGLLPFGQEQALRFSRSIRPSVACRTDSTEADVRRDDGGLSSFRTFPCKIARGNHRSPNVPAKGQVSIEPQAAV